MKSKEIKSLTGVRGIAAIIIAVHHFSAKYLVPKLEADRDNSFIDSFVFNYSNNGYLMVELFFILSGFVLSLSYASKFSTTVSFDIWKRYMIKRFNRIYPLYFFSLILYFFIFNYKSANDLFILAINIPFLELWFSKTYSLNNVSWSLCAEWFTYLIFPYLLFKSLEGNYKTWHLITCALIIYILAPLLNTEILYYSNLSFTVGDLRMSGGTGAFLRCLGSYFVGIGVYKVYKNRPELVQWLSNRWYFVLGLILVFYGFNKTDIILSLLFGILILSLIGDNFLSRLFSSKVIYFLGLISYSLYLMHMIFLRIIIYSFKIKVWEENILTLSISFLIFMVTSVIFSFLTYRIIEMPCNTYLKNKLII